jgi:hypothetical protein
MQTNAFRLAGLPYFSSRGRRCGRHRSDCTLLKALLNAVVHTHAQCTRTLRVRPLILIGRRRVRLRGATARFCIDARALRGMRSGSEASGSPATELNGCPWLAAHAPSA